MDYDDAVNRLERLRPFSPNLGTETTAALLDHLGGPHEGLTAVQVAGSNGKGSTARLLDSVFGEAGLTVGLYTSPDLNDFRERIRVAGRKIPKHQVVRFVEETWPYVLDESARDDGPTYFEVVTAMALWYFDRQDVDVAVLEVGIGGRYDATSVVDPVASAVTTVSLEHTDILGSTVEEIARDKAHVTPDDRALVTGATGDALDAIRETTDVVTVTGRSTAGTGDDDQQRAATSADVRVTETEMVSTTESALSLVGPDFTVETRTPLLGRHQAANAGIAAVLARQVAGASETEVALGIRNVTWPGRFEVMERDPLAVLDGAHNPAACQRLAALVSRFEYGSLHLVFGALRDKDHAEMCRALPSAETTYLAAPNVGRAQDTAVLATLFERETGSEIRQTESILGALERALGEAETDDLVLVTGSLYTVAEARDRWTRQPVDSRIETESEARAVLRTADVPRAKRERTADRLVHRTVRFHVRRTDAASLTETMLSLGGHCSVSGIEAATEHVQVVLSGTREQFRALVGRLDDQGDGMAHLTEQLRGRLDRSGDESDGYPWDDGTAVMGRLDVTPDSFHDAGGNLEPDEAAAHARKMIEAGAEIIDVSAESTRPDAGPVPPGTAHERVVPVLESVAGDVTVAISTRTQGVAAAALDAGADIVNDVSGLADAGMRHLVAESDVPAVVTRRPSAAVDPDQEYEYDDVVADRLSELTERLLLAERAGIDRSRLLVDPGFGGDGRTDGSDELLDRLDEFEALGTPVLVDHAHGSRLAPAGNGEDRLPATLARTTLAVERGADVVRVPAVPETVAAVTTAVRTAGDVGRAAREERRNRYTGRRNY